MQVKERRDALQKAKEDRLKDRLNDRYSMSASLITSNQAQMSIHKHNQLLQ